MSVYRIFKGVHLVRNMQVYIRVMKQHRTYLQRLYLLLYLLLGFLVDGRKRESERVREIDRRPLFSPYYTCILPSVCSCIYTLLVGCMLFRDPFFQSFCIYSQTPI
eukprot:sb/3477789/